jgi:hypothetical protein
MFHCVADRNRNYLLIVIRVFVLAEKLPAFLLRQQASDKPKGVKLPT